MLLHVIFKQGSKREAAPSEPPPRPFVECKLREQGAWGTQPGARFLVCLSKTACDNSTAHIRQMNPIHETLQSTERQNHPC